MTKLHCGQLMEENKSNQRANIFVKGKKLLLDCFSGVCGCGEAGVPPLGSSETSLLFSEILKEL